MVKQMISFADAQHRFLKAEAKRLGISLAELTRRAIDTYMEKNKPLTADTPSDDVLTQRYISALQTLNHAPIGNLTASDLEWMTGELKHRWRANFHKMPLHLPSLNPADNRNIVERLEGLVAKIAQ